MQLQECFDILNIRAPAADLAFADVRKAFLRAALLAHPDKPGGDEAKFVAAHNAFEALRTATQNGKIALVDLDGKALDPTISVEPRRSAEYYEEAAAAMPSYMFERAKTGRGKCGVDQAPIAEGEVKVGSLVPELGEYGRWVRLANWKVSSAVQACLSLGDGPASVLDAKTVTAELLEADGLIVSGIAQLDETSLSEVVAHVATKSKWARATTAGDEAKERTQAKLDGRSKSSTSDAAAVAPAVTLPSPADPNALKGLKFVLSGKFDGNGVGLAAGKGDMKQSIVRLGGTVVGGLSKKVDVLLVGDAPGAAKIEKANELKISVMDVQGLNQFLDGERSLVSVDPPKIQRLSSGFGGNGIAKRMDDEERRALVDAATAPRLGKREREDALSDAKVPRLELSA